MDIRKLFLTEEEKAPYVDEIGLGVLEGGDRIGETEAIHLIAYKKSSETQGSAVNKRALDSMRKLRERELDNTYKALAFRISAYSEAHLRVPGRCSCSCTLRTRD